MAASQRQLQRYIFDLSRNFRLRTFYIFYCDVILQRNEFLWIFLGKGFHEKCKHTEIALNIQKHDFTSKKTLSFYHSRIATP